MYEFKIALKTNLQSQGAPKILPLMLERTAAYREYLNRYDACYFSLTINIYPTVFGAISSIHGIPVKESDLNSSLWDKLVDNLKELNVYPGTASKKSKQKASLVRSIAFTFADIVNKFGSKSSLPSKLNMTTCPT